VTVPRPRLEDAIAAFLGEQAEEFTSDVCPVCRGDGWYIGHEDACYDTGDCQCGGVQVRCDCEARA